MVQVRRTKSGKYQYFDKKGKKVGSPKSTRKAALAVTKGKRK